MFVRVSVSTLMNKEIVFIFRTYISYFVMNNVMYECNLFLIDIRGSRGVRDETFVFGENQIYVIPLIPRNLFPRSGKTS